MLTPKQQVFLDEYLTCWNATEAARRAEYAHPNKQGPALLVNLGIQEAIRARLAEKTMGADEVLVRLTEHARGSLADFISVTDKGDWRLDLTKAARAGSLHLIKKLKDTKYGTEIVLHDPQHALELLGKHYGLFTSDGDDWRDEAARAGLNAAEIFNNLVNAFAATLQARAGSTDPRRLGSGEDADTIIDSESGA